MAHPPVTRSIIPIADCAITFGRFNDAVVIARASAEIRFAHTGKVDEIADRMTGRAKLGFARPGTLPHGWPHRSYGDSRTQKKVMLLFRGISALDPSVRLTLQALFPCRVLDQELPAFGR